MFPLPPYRVPKRNPIARLSNFPPQKQKTTGGQRGLAPFAACSGGRELRGSGKEGPGALGATPVALAHPSPAAARHSRDNCSTHLSGEPADATLMSRSSRSPGAPVAGCAGSVWGASCLPRPLLGRACWRFPLAPDVSSTRLVRGPAPSLPHPGIPRGRTSSPRHPIPAGPR